MAFSLQSDLAITTLRTMSVQAHFLRGQWLSCQYIAAHLPKDTWDTATLLLGEKGVVVKGSGCICLSFSGRLV